MSTGRSSRKKRGRGLKKLYGEALLNKQLGHCGLCWEPLDASYDIDHIKPLGTHWKGQSTNANVLVNLQATHRLCNHRKGNSAMWINRYLLETVFLWRAHGSPGGPLNALEFLVCLPELRLSAVNVSWGWDQQEGHHFSLYSRDETVLPGDLDTIELFCQHAEKIPDIPYEYIADRMDMVLVPDLLEANRPSSSAS